MIPLSLRLSRNLGCDVLDGTKLSKCILNTMYVSSRMLPEMKTKMKYLFLLQILGDVVAKLPEHTLGQVTDID
jgi:hypothetical protein